MRCLHFLKISFLGSTGANTTCISKPKELVAKWRPSKNFNLEGWNYDIKNRWKRYPYPLGSDESECSIWVIPHADSDWLLLMRLPLITYWKISWRKTYLDRDSADSWHVLSVTLTNSSTETASSSGKSQSRVNSISCKTASILQSSMSFIYESISENK